MALKCFINSPDDVAEPLRSLYAKTADGRYALALDGEPHGYVKAEKLAQFRANNRSLNAQNAELAAKLKAFDGIDPTDDADAEFEALEAKLKAFDGVDPAEYHALKARPDTSARVAELEATLAAEQRAHAQTQFTHAVATEFLRAGGRASAVDYMVAQAATVFAMTDGALTTSEFSSSRPGEPLTLAEWMQGQSSTADFAFLPSRGGGAPVGVSDHLEARESGRTSA
ncbi:MAG: hypothetical protein KA371_20420 [Acidobacteria bacterium]|nr:hypothetical protein [Acidobacteriota bacterium]